MDCFRELSYHSDGAGREIGRWERGGKEMRDLVVVPHQPGGREGFMVYSGDEVFFQRIPPKELKFSYRVWPFEMKLPDREIFRCTYYSTDVKGSQPTVECSFLDKEKRYDKVKPNKVKGDEETRWPLKSAILLRMQDATLKFRKKADRYLTILEEYRKEKANPGTAESLRRFLGWRSQPPVPPLADSLIKVLDRCGRTEDEGLRSSARSAKNTLERISLPFYKE